MITASKFVSEAYGLIGQPYLWGGNGETLADIVSDYATKKEQSKSATDEMIQFLQRKTCVNFSDIHFQDCSGMIVEILRKNDCVSKTFDMTAEGLYKECKKIKTPCEGALAFYYDGKKHNHVGICHGGNIVVHCLSVKTGVIAEPIEKRKDKWVEFGLLNKYIEYDIDTITTYKGVAVYRTADEADKNDTTKSVTIYKPNTYYIYRTYGNCVNITKTLGVAGGWVRKDILTDAEEW